MPELVFVARSEKMGDLGNVALSADELASFLGADSGVCYPRYFAIRRFTCLMLDIKMDRQFTSAGDGPSLWMTFTVGAFLHSYI